MRSASDTAVVVLNWNRGRQTLQCLQSLASLWDRPARVIVVDNGSSDGSADLLRAREPSIDLICAGENRGYAAGNNLGIRRARSLGVDFVWLLNNDALATPESLGALLRRARADPRVGAVGSLLLGGRSDRAPIWGGGRISFFSGLPYPLTPVAAPSRLDYLQGASLLLRLNALDEVGDLDEGFFLYWEDADLCFRLRRAGWTLAVAADSIILHRGHGSMALRSVQWDYHFTASSVRFFRRHAVFPALPIAVSAAGRALGRLVVGRAENARAVWTALREVRSAS